MEINFTQTFTAFVPLVTGIMQAVKIAGLHKRYVPLTAVAIGMALCFGWYGLSVSALYMGIIAGLASSGLWSVYNSKNK